MTISDVLAILALLISCLSFVLSFLAFRTDRGILKAWCELRFNHHKALEGDPELHVYAVNVGKRELTLKYLLIKRINGFSNVFLREPNFIKNANGMVVGLPDILEHELGINLTESRMHHVVFSSNDWTTFYDESGICDELYFEDSIGTKHKVKNSKQTIGKFIEAAKV